MIVIEDLKVSNMSKSAKGTTERPGRNVKAKSGLNRSILEQGWYEMRRQLEYKQLWRGGQVLYALPTPVRSALAVVIQQRKTASHKVNSSALNVDIQRMLISTGYVTF